MNSVIAQRPRLPIADRATAGATVRYTLTPTDLSAVISLRRASMPKVVRTATRTAMGNTRWMMNGVKNA